MGRMIAYGIAIVGSFALAAGGSWYLNQEPAEEGDEQAATDVENPNADATETKPDVDVPEVEPQAMPSAVPPRSMSAEDLYRIGEIMKTREQAIARRESALENEARRLKLVMRDIDAEQQETDGLFTQVRGTLESATQMLDQLRDESERLSASKTEEQKKTPADNSVKLPDANEMKNLKRWSTILQGMEPGSAAGLLTKLANEGQIDMVVRIMSQFEERKAAKILEAVTDDQLVVQIAEKSAKLRQPDKKAERR